MDTYSRGNLPADGWAAYRKHSETPMVDVTGPFRVITQEGSYDLPEGWRGSIAVDRAGYPYPIEETERDRAYQLSRRIESLSDVLPAEALVDAGRLADRTPKGPAR